jgi:hypothetical protein
MRNFIVILLREGSGSLTVNVLMVCAIGDFDADCFDSWLNIDYMPIQYLLNRTGNVVGSSDERDREAYQVRNEEVARARNKILETAMALDWDYILWIDSDVEVPTTLITDMLKFAPKEKVITAVAKYRPIPGVREEASVLNYRGEDGYALWTGWHCVMVAREVHENVGMFTADIRGEDIGYSEAMQQCGYNICIADKVKVIHHYDRTVRKPYKEIKVNKISLKEKCPVCGHEGVMVEEEGGKEYYECPVNHHSWEKETKKAFAPYPGVVDIGGWSFVGEGRILYDLARGSSQIEGVVVELGTYKCLSTIYLASGSPDKVYSVDTHEFGTYEEARSNLDARGVGDNASLIIGFTEDVGKEWKKPIRLLFVDADHTYEGVKKDIIAWTPFIVEGGYIVFHDTNYPDISKAIEESLKKDTFSEVELPFLHGSLRCFRRMK